MKTINIQILILIVLASCNHPKEINSLQGKVKREVISIASKYPGRIETSFINEGDHIKKGDTLALLNMPEVEAKNKQAQGVVDAAKAQYEMALSGATDDQLAQVTAKLQAVKEQYNFAQKSYDRIKIMHDDSLISDQQYDEVYMKLQGAKAQYEGVKAKYDEVKNGVRNEKVRMALGTYERALGAQEEATVAYAERYVIAPQDMSIETIALKEGELALPGYGLFTGYKDNSVFFRFTVAESEVNQFKKGHHYTVSSPFTEDEFDTQLISIKQLTQYANITSAFPEYELGESTYELKLIPLDIHKADNLYTNLTVLLAKK